MEELLTFHAEHLLANDNVIDVEIDGCVLTDKYTLYKDAILNFEVRDSDVWVCSFPKTGTTWTQEMVWLLVNNMDYEGATVKLPERFTFIEFRAMFNPRNPDEDTIELDDVMDKLKDMKSRRFIKTHLPWQHLPRQIQDGTKKPKIIYITRDPKDVCVSYYHHNKLWGRITYEFHTFCDVFLADKHEFQPFWDHIFGFWNRRQQENIIFLRYEELQHDLSAIINRVADYFEVQLSEDDVQELKEHLSFAKMKDNNAVNYMEYVKFYRERHYTSYIGEFMRSGYSGSYKTWMTPEMIDKFNKWIAENTSGTDFKFYTD